MALPAAFPMIKAYGSGRNEGEVKVMQVNEIIAEAWECVWGIVFCYIKSVLEECGFFPQK